MDRTSRHNPDSENIWYGGLRIVSLLFADDVVLLALSDPDFHCTLGWFVARSKAAGTRVSSSRSEAIVLCWKVVDCSFQFLSESLPQVKDFKYLGSCTRVGVRWS